MQKFLIEGCLIISICLLFSVVLVSCKQARGTEYSKPLNDKGESVVDDAKGCQRVDPTLQTWEIFNPNGGNSIIRLKVPCGWLVKTNASATSFFAFIPDPSHNWNNGNENIFQ